MEQGDIDGHRERLRPYSQDRRRSPRCLETTPNSSGKGEICRTPSKLLCLRESSGNRRIRVHGPPQNRRRQSSCSVIGGGETVGAHSRSSPRYGDTDRRSFLDGLRCGPGRVHLDWKPARARVQAFGRHFSAHPRVLALPFAISAIIASLMT
jgi:hypothetical protein